LVFEKSANFFAENWQKSQKIVVTTLTPVYTNNEKSVARHGATTVESFLIVSRVVAQQEATKISLFM
jgi:hypothetical protein